MLNLSIFYLIFYIVINKDNWTEMGMANWLANALVKIMAILQRYIQLFSSMISLNKCQNIKVRDFERLQQKSRRSRTGVNIFIHKSDMLKTSNVKLGNNNIIPYICNQSVIPMFMISCHDSLYLVYFLKYLPTFQALVTIFPLDMDSYALFAKINVLL